MTRKQGRNSIKKFDLKEGFQISDRYVVVKKLGEGWESEVYIVREKLTGIDRAAKIFFPQRNTNNIALKHYAKKLHKLRKCPIIIQYITQDYFYYKDRKVSILISELVDGISLAKFVKSFRGNRLSLAQALTLLYFLAKGIEALHNMRDYHGDLHFDNIIVQKYGVGFDVKAIDFFNWGKSSREHYLDDVVDLIKIFYECLGGAKYYRKQPQFVKEICCGLKRKLIAKKFRNAGQLRTYLEGVNLLSL